MILIEACGHKRHPAYQKLAEENLKRQMDFLHSLVDAALEARRPFLSETVIRALNYHATACLHAYPGEYRTYPVQVDGHTPPQPFRIQSLMEDFINHVNLSWQNSDPLTLASYVFWRLNWIHPFIDGNGRTARAACYFTLCINAGGWLPGKILLPELLVQNHDEYVQALQEANNSLKTDQLTIDALHTLLSKLLQQQLDSANPDEAEKVRTSLGLAAQA